MQVRPRTYWWPALTLWALAGSICPALAAEEDSEI
jgi:hypothetical protein